MNTLLLNPEFPDTFWSFRHALKFTRQRALMPPLGLLTAGALLPGDWTKRLADLNVARLSDRDLAWADCAFISGMTIQRNSAASAIRRCREAGLRIIAGGPLFTMEPELFPEVDHLVLGEAELTLPPLLEDLASGKARRSYTTTETADLSRSPIPLWELADFSKYHMMCLQFSRGCPFDCDFCNVTQLFGRRPRVKSADQVLEELDLLSGLGWRGNVFFVDDNLIGDRRRLKQELLPALVRWRRDRRGFAFNTQVSINLADDETLMRLMTEAGFNSVFIGIETPEDEGLAECSKRQNVGRDLVEDTRRIQRAGMQVQGGFIIGFDSDTPSVFQRQIDLIQNSGIVTAMVGLLQAPPGTRLYQRMKKAGRLLELDWGNNVDGLTNIIPRMNLEDLREGYRKLLQHIYRPSVYYKRVRTFLKEYQPTTISVPLNRDNLLAFLRSIYRLGLFGRERFQYWRLLRWTLCHRPRLFSLAVTLAIYGHHFRRVCALRAAQG